MQRDRAKIVTFVSTLLLMSAGAALPLYAGEGKAVQELLDELKGKGATARTLLAHKLEIKKLSDEEFLTFCNKLPEALFGDKWDQDGVGMIACHFALELRGLDGDRYLGEISRKENHPAFREALIRAYFDELFGGDAKADQNMQERAIREVIATFLDRDAKKELRYYAFSEGIASFALVSAVLSRHANLRRKIEREEGIDKIQANPKAMQMIRTNLEKKYSGEELERRLKIAEQAQITTARGKAWEKVDLGKYELPDDLRRAFNLKKEYLRAVFEVASRPDEDPRLLQMAINKLIEVASDKRHFLNQEAEAVLQGISARLSEYPSKIQRLLHKSLSGRK